MKCPRCGLNNLEHVKICVKCNNVLVGLSLPENFSPEPSRAKWFNHFKRLYWKWRRSRRVILPESSYEPKTPFWKDPLKAFYYGEPVPGSLLAMIFSFLLPGTGQFFLKRRTRGIIFIIPGLLALLTFALATYNYSLGALRMSSNIYLVFQCIAVFDAMPRVRAERVADWFVNIFLAVGVWLGCFIVMNHAVTYSTGYFWDGGELRTIMYNYPDSCLVRRGDTVLIIKEQAYSRGDIVIFNSMPYLYGNRLIWNNNYIGVDKIIGLPGETVNVKAGIISIDSVKLDNKSKRTLLPCKIPDMQWKLGKNEYFIISSNAPQALLKRFPDVRKASVINIERINGRIARIVSPWDRIRKL